MSMMRFISLFFRALTARAMAIMGAELIFYPTAIGSEPILESDSMPHWRRCMQGHSAANLVPVVAANRIGTEICSVNIFIKYIYY